MLQLGMLSDMLAHRGSSRVPCMQVVEWPEEVPRAGVASPVFAA
jgi:hypothetical protein